jgi:hypothetical protein
VKASVKNDRSERILLSPGNIIVPNNLSVYLSRGSSLRIGEEIQKKDHGAGETRFSPGAIRDRHHLGRRRQRSLFFRGITP